jgi:hypothetical protein
VTLTQWRGDWGKENPGLWWTHRRPAGSGIEIWGGREDPGLAYVPDHSVVGGLGSGGERGDEPAENLGLAYVPDHCIMEHKANLDRGWKNVLNGKPHDWAILDAILTLRATLMATQLEVMKDSSILLQLQKSDPMVLFA